ncbi:MAG: hypothetical protein WA964_04775 [Ilumatobacter sp.]|uniref:hypothetical protein n=1 Tax=Ilumatobacter sp. TaxID=1967498 RepID=UPI003C790766
MTCTTHSILRHSTGTGAPGARPVAASPAVPTASFGRRRTIAARLRSAALWVWRLLPPLSSSTPSDEAISTLSPSDRLGERR